MSLSQFRPEKNHALQIKSFARFLLNCPWMKVCDHHVMFIVVKNKGKSKLILVGGCRNDGDAKRVDELKTLRSTLGLSENVSVCNIINI